jgi:hypothetical protein
MDTALTRLIVREDFTAVSRRESFKFYFTMQTVRRLKENQLESEDNFQGFHKAVP